tara:strand:- start:556 stop:942 length:387 start_codon:yes stop_codon:yes gene_type:complete
MKLPTLEEMRAELTKGDNPLSKKDADLKDERFVRAYYSLRVYQELHPRATNKDIAQFMLILLNSYDLDFKDILDVNKITMFYIFDLNKDDPEFNSMLKEEIRNYQDQIYELKRKIVLAEEQIDKKKLH